MRTREELARWIEALRTIAATDATLLQYAARLEALLRWGHLDEEAIAQLCLEAETLVYLYQRTHGWGSDAPRPN